MPFDIGPRLLGSRGLELPRLMGRLEPAINGPDLHPFYWTELEHWATYRLGGLADAPRSEISAKRARRPGAQPPGAPASRRRPTDSALTGF